MENKYCFSRVILLGSGRLAWQCAAECGKRVENVEVLEYRVTDSTILQKLCLKDNIRYLCCDKGQMYERLSAVTEETLVVSAGNTWLIPGEIVAKENLYIINWHNALLPRHKGRNAEAWSIYEGDLQTGITWHRLTAAVDAGDIILQRSIEIDSQVTALELFREQCELGAQTFKEILEALLLKKCELRHQVEGENCKIHYSHEIPNGGYLDLKWDAGKMSRFLRAMDYGGLMLMGEMRVLWQGKEYCFHKYKIAEAGGADAVVWQGRDMVIHKDGQQITLKNLNSPDEKFQAENRQS